MEGTCGDSPTRTDRTKQAKSAAGAPTPTAPGHRTRARILALVTGSYATSPAGSCKDPLHTRCPTGPDNRYERVGQASVLAAAHEPVMTAHHEGNTCQESPCQSSLHSPKTTPGSSSSSSSARPSASGTGASRFR